MLKEWFTKYNLDESTELNPLSFFVNACKAYDVPISNILKKTARNKTASSVARGKKRWEGLSYAFQVTKREIGILVETDGGISSEDDTNCSYVLGNTTSFNSRFSQMCNKVTHLCFDPTNESEMVSHWSKRHT